MSKHSHGRAVDTRLAPPPLLAMSQTPNGNSVSRQAGAAGSDGRPSGWQNGGVRCKNHILATLPPDVWERLAPQMRRVLLHQGDVLQESGTAVEYAYFIES